MTSLTGLLKSQTAADNESNHQNDSDSGGFHYNLPCAGHPPRPVVISGRLRLRIDFGQSQFLSVGYLFRCKRTEGLYNRGYSGHEEGNSLLGANSTAGRSCALAAKYIWYSRSARFNSSGSLAMFAAILRASSFVSSLAADRPLRFEKIRVLRLT